MSPRVALVASLALLAALPNGGGAIAGAPQRTARNAAPLRARAATWQDVSTVVDRLAGAVPAILRDAPAADRPARWNTWREAHWNAISERIAQGDEDSIVNLLLFGTTYTAEPRLTVDFLADLNRRWNAGDRAAEQLLTKAYQQRAADLVDSARQPSAGERMRFVRRVLESQGHNLASDAGRRAATDYLLARVIQVRQEAAALAKQLEALRAGPDATASFAERSRLFRDRGLSADSSVLTQFAVDRALAALVDRGILGARSISRIAIVGPGLDFVDKQEGFDFYEPQTLQPFTAVDSLYRSGLASDDLRLTTIDVSARVNAHIRQAVDRAAGNRSYRLVLPWDSRAHWLDDALAYWRHAGDRIGKSVALTAPPLPGVMARAIAVRPDVVRRVQAVDASIVSDRLDLPERERFDLVIATNVLVYYDTFEQTLALASIAAMLRPGGVLLTNDAVLEIPEVSLRSQGYLAVPFSKREGDGERMIWYVRDGR